MEFLNELQNLEVVEKFGESGAELQGSCVFWSCNSGTTIAY